MLTLKKWLIVMDDATATVQAHVLDTEGAAAVFTLVGDKPEEGQLEAFPVVVHIAREYKSIISVDYGTIQEHRKRWF